VNVKAAGTTDRAGFAASLPGLNFFFTERTASSVSDGMCRITVTSSI